MLPPSHGVKICHKVLMVEVHLKHVLRQFGGKQLEIWEVDCSFWMRKGRAFEMEAVLFCYCILPFVVQEMEVFSLLLYEHVVTIFFYMYTCKNRWMFLIYGQQVPLTVFWFSMGRLVHGICHKIAEDLRMAFDEGSSFEIYAGRAWCGNKLEQGSWNLKSESFTVIWSDDGKW